MTTAQLTEFSQLAADLEQSVPAQRKAWKDLMSARNRLRRGAGHLEDLIEPLDAFIENRRRNVQLHRDLERLRRTLGL